jgi:hypothetical protein
MMRVFQAQKQRGKGAKKRLMMERLLGLFASLLLCVITAQSQTIRWVPDPSNPNQVAVEVVGLQVATLQYLQRVRWEPSQWQRLFPVSTETADVAMLGAYRVQGLALRFEPQFPLEPGLTYRAEFHPAQLTRKADNAPIKSTFRLPPRDLTPTTTVTHVYPSGEVVPENLLKFYLHFSAPMQRGNIYQYIQLRDSAGQVVELPFLEIDEELWDTTLTRLTVFIDPGRIKRGVLPLEEIGPSLQAGKNYTLVIRSDWKDSNGAPLKAEFKKSFRVVAPDREPPDPKHWKVQAPSSGSGEPLVISFPEPMDQALAVRVIRVMNAAGHMITGEVHLADHERQWIFRPQIVWARGTYQLVIQTTLEDLAGNNIGKPFEVDLFAGVERHLKMSAVNLPFEIR